MNFAKANSDFYRWYANCRKYPDPKNCGYFRWLDDIVANERVLSKIGTNLSYLSNLIILLGISSNIKILRTDKSIYFSESKYHLPTGNLYKVSH